MARNQRTRRRNQTKAINKAKVTKALILLAVIIIAITIIVIKNNKKQTTSGIEEIEQTQEGNIENKEQKEEKKDKVTFTLTSVGDIMCHNTQYMDAYDAQKGAYDFGYVYNDVKYYLQTGDITVGNLETTFGGPAKKYSSYPTFNTPDELALTLKNIGFDLLSTANNHCMDTGYDGLSRTIDVLEKADIAHLGTYKTEEDKQKVAIQYAKGVKIAFVNYTYGTNGITVPSDKKYCVNLINKDQMAQDIEKAKSENPDLIVAMMHWGQEYQTKPNQEQQDLAEFLFQNGVDIILGGHPHVLQSMEKREITLADGTQKEGFVIYSQGNFSADQKEDNTKASIILNLTITREEDGKISIEKAEYIPIQLYKNTQSATHKFKLLDIKKEIEKYESGQDTSLRTSKSYIFTKTAIKYNTISRT